MVSSSGTSRTRLSISSLVGPSDTALYSSTGMTAQDTTMTRRCASKRKSISPSDASTESVSPSSFSSPPTSATAASSSTTKKTTTNNVSDQVTPAKRKSRPLRRKTDHSVIERRRREKINERLIRLQETVPACREEAMELLDAKKPKKGSPPVDKEVKLGEEMVLEKLCIISHTVDYIHQLRSQVDAYRRMCQCEPPLDINEAVTPNDRSMHVRYAHEHDEALRTGSTSSISSCERPGGDAALGKPMDDQQGHQDPVPSTVLKRKRHWGSNRPIKCSEAKQDGDAVSKRTRTRANTTTGGANDQQDSNDAGDDSSDESGLDFELDEDEDESEGAGEGRDNGDTTAQTQSAHCIDPNEPRQVPPAATSSSLMPSWMQPREAAAAFHTHRQEQPPRDHADGGHRQRRPSILQRVPGIYSLDPLRTPHQQHAAADDKETQRDMNHSLDLSSQVTTAQGTKGACVSGTPDAVDRLSTLATLSAVR